MESIKGKTKQDNGGSADNLAQRLRKWTHVRHRFAKAYGGMFAGLEWPHSKSTLEVLLYLYRVKKEAEPSVIADFMYMPRQTMTSLLDTMVKNGFVVSNPHPTDRRRKLVRLTGGGRTTIRRLLNSIRAGEREAVSRVADERFDEMISVLDEVCSSMEGWAEARKKTAKKKNAAD